ncbi:MAG: hypothetical protein KKA79_03265 [Nanoarchaeota archaeon]|nr:hypothetical protein [Nanoarchaeota archaeon]MCG2718761.1 hypothetical protein [Nanoarchaeota archaeon]
MTKRLISIMFVLTISFAMISSAVAEVDVSALKKEKTTLQDAMGALEKEFNLNEAKVPRLEQRKSDLEWSAKQVQKSADNWNAANARLEIKTYNYKADVATHNSRCDRTVDTQGEYDACVRSKNALDSRKATLERDIQYNEEQRATVQELIDNQAAQKQILQKEIDAYLAHRKELVDAGNRIQARLDEIQSYLNSCEDAIAAYDRSADPMKDGTLERMKAECGSMFDGN